MDNQIVYSSEEILSKIFIIYLCITFLQHLAKTFIVLMLAVICKSIYMLLYNNVRNKALVVNLLLATLPLELGEISLQLTLCVLLS